MDKAAEAILDITTASNEAENDSSPVFQVTSTSHTTTYRDAISIAESAGLKFELVPPTAWLAKLQAARDSGTEHCCLKMLPTWERNVGASPLSISCPLSSLCSGSQCSLFRSTRGLPKRRRIRWLSRLATPSDIRKHWQRLQRSLHSCAFSDTGKSKA